MGGVVVGVYMGVVMVGDVVSVGRVECGECRVTPSKVCIFQFSYREIDQVIISLGFRA